jgi:Carboxypeptidase regulatory-like domain/TonB-dependent Receptor Plug Domain
MTRLGFTKKHLRTFGSFVLLAAMVVGPFGSAFVVFGQENAGSIQGQVKDQTGAIISGAKVTASSSALVRQLDATTDANGGYLFPKTPVGTYTVSVTRQGFKTVTSDNIAVQLGKTSTVDFELPAGQVSESVTVTAGGSETIDLTSSKTATNITEKFMDNTPKGRTFNSILAAAPGVVYDTRAGSAAGGATGTSGNNPGGGVGGYSVNGASGSENAFIIDGVEVSNVRNAALGRESAIPFEFVREVQVKSGGFEAEYGGATGGVVNVITKSGSDDFHGQVSLSFTNSLMNSAPRGFYQLTPGNSDRAEFYLPKEDTYSSIFPGFSLGGPIIKQRLNFFTSYFPEFSRTQRDTAFLAGAKTTTNRTTRHYGLARVDYSPTQKMQFNSSYLWTPIRSTGALTGTDIRIAPPSTNFANLGGYTPANAYTASFTYTPTSKTVVSARYGYKYLNDKGNTYGLPSGPWVRYLRATSGSSYVGPAVPSAFAGPSGFNNITSPFMVLFDVTTRKNLYLDASQILRIAGQQHTIKGGYAENRIANRIEDDYPNGRFDIYWGEDFSRGTPGTPAYIDHQRGTYGYYRWEDGVRHKAGANSSNRGFYIQDQWQAHSRVTVNAGVRFEREFLPPFKKTTEDGKLIPNPVDFGWGDKIAPRVGVAVDVLGNGKWKLSGSWGIFVDTLKYELARTSFAGEFWFSHVYKLSDPDVTKLNKANAGALGAEIITFDNRSAPINAQGQLDGIDPDIKPLSNSEWTIASEHNLGANSLLSFRFTSKHLRYGIEDIGVLDEFGSEVYTIGNPGFGLTAPDAPPPYGGRTSSGEPLTPKATRDYHAFEVRYDKRFTEGFARNLNVFASYTYSRLYGNWAGLANSDENGRSQPNVSRAFDLSPGNFNGQGKNVFGLLATDRPNQFKLFGNYLLNTRAGGTTFSLSQLAFSGTPLSSTATFIVPAFYNGRGDLGRTPFFTQTDFLIAHSFNVTERVSVKFDANIINLLNQAIVVGRSTARNRSGDLNTLAPDPFGGYDAEALIPVTRTSTNIDPSTGKLYVSPFYNPIYNFPTSYQGNREIRLGFHVIF